MTIDDHDDGVETGSRSDRYDVSPLELFFDLVFVLGVSRLSHHLIDDLTWRAPPRPS